jgi:flagellar biosynthesis protein FlhF
MPLETFVGPDVGALFERAQRKLGEEAVVVHTRRIRHWDGSEAFELLAGDASNAGDDLNVFLTRGNANELTNVSPAAIPRRRKRGQTGGPLTIVLVGPTGAGKTTTIAKLLGHPRIFGTRSVGVLSLDTYRVGAVEQISTYAAIAHAPLETVYETAEVGSALKRLSDLDVILVDTPGRGPRNQRDAETVQRWLSMINPDEIHLALQVGLQCELTTRIIAHYQDRGVTHLLPTKLDELPNDWGLFETAATMHLPMRWMTDGQEVPTDIRAAKPRLLAALASVEHGRQETIGANL